MGAMRQVSPALLLHLLYLVTITWASGPPKVDGQPQQRHVAKLGKNTRLVCPVHADPPPLTQWKKDGQTINMGWPRFKVTQDGQLRIQDVQMTDAGMYICRATNGFGSISVNYTVVVLDEEKKIVQHQDQKFPQSPDEDLTREGMAPVFSKRDMRTHVMRPVGSTVRLSCRAEGNPEPRIAWYKEGRLLEETESKRRRPHWILKLTKVREVDAGEYMCMVSNRLGQLNHTYAVEVIDYLHSKPKLISPHPQNTTVEHGATASFQCRVKSVMQPKVKWLKRVEDSEAAESLNTTIEVKGQNFVVLRTAGEVWSGPDGSYLNKLVIHHAQPRDAGMYICLGANSMGYSFRSAYLQVVPAGQLDAKDGDKSSSSSYTGGSSNNLPLFVGLPAGGVVILVIVGLLLLQKRRCCGTSQSSLKRHRLPVPSHDRDTGYHSYHHSPATTNTNTNTNPNIVATGMTSSNNFNTYTPKTPAPSLDFGSDISSVSHSQPHQHQQPSQHHLPPQQPMHFYSTHNTYSY